jgi:YidC/Oxa1 family membrane protein insertase
MDKKNITIGVALLLAAFASMYFTAPQPQPAPAPGRTDTPAASGVADPAAVATSDQPPGVTTVPTTARPTEIKALSTDVVGAQASLLANSFIEVRLTNYGGAIKEVALRKFAETLGSSQHYILNQPRTGPMLGIVDLPGLGQDTGFEVVSQTAKEVVYRTVLDGRIEVTRRYYLPDGSEPGTDPYQLKHETTLRNLTDETLALPRLALSIGTVIPTSDNVYGLRMNNGYSDGKDQHFIENTKLEGGGFLSMFGIGSRVPTPELTTNSSVQWASLSNQFFTTILTPSQPGVGLITRRVPLNVTPETSPHLSHGLGAETLFDLKPLGPQTSVTLAADFYVGPKEYPRLSNGDVFKADQDKVMHYGFFRFFSQILLTMMDWVHGWMEPISPQWGWGWAVVITTLILKIVFLPLTLAAAKSGKRMQKLQPEMKELREKFKDNPQKMQQATMELFKKHKVNPMGGCLPILLTMPFFFGFFIMLQSAAELRFESFLWASDLAAPDTVARVFGLPINIMPLLMGATMIIQMRLTPMPSTDNAQVKIMKFMPWIFTLFCYNFSCALALYSTVNGAFTIGQQLVINRMKDDGDPAPTPAPAGGRRVKNVTPREK